MTPLEWLAARAEIARHTGGCRLEDAYLDYREHGGFRDLATFIRELEAEHGLIRAEHRQKYGPVGGLWLWCVRLREPGNLVAEHFDGVNEVVDGGDRVKARVSERTDRVLNVLDREPVLLSAEVREGIARSAGVVDGSSDVVSFRFNAHAAHLLAVVALVALAIRRRK